jgi:hypothetical protein
MILSKLHKKFLVGDLFRIVCQIRFLSIFDTSLKCRTLYGQLVVLLFLASFLAQTYSRFFIIADYYANTAKYAALCENKAILNMHCNGKCQLMKKLKQDEKDQQENQERAVDNKNEVVFFTPSSFSLAEPVIDLTASEWSTMQSYGPSLLLCVDIFRPPRA